VKQINCFVNWQSSAEITDKMILRLRKKTIRDAKRLRGEPTLIGLTLLIILSLSITARSAPGDLDTSFGTGGKVITDVNNQRNEARKAVIQSDGKIIVGGGISGTNTDFLLVRYNTNGSLDSTFGSGGIVITDNNGNSDNLGALAIQADGKILAFGNTGRTGVTPGVLLVRYNTDGTLDNSFGTGGMASASFGNFIHFGYSLVIQPDGKIVGVGATRDSANLPVMFAIRFNMDGTLDTGFDTDGKVTVSFGGTDVGSASSVNLQPDGKLVLAGITDDPVTFRDFALARLNGDGSLDSSFGSGGKVTTNVDRSDGVSDSAIQPDGKIVLVGYSNTGSKIALVRYKIDGNIDETFGNGGKVETVAATGENFGASITFQPDGKILAGASSGVFPNRRFALVRYNTNGLVDTSFGMGGVTLTPISSNSLDTPKSVLLQGDGKIVLAGDTSRIDSNQTGFDFAVVRYLNDLFAPAPRSPFDFDGDGKTDISIFRPTVGEWWINQSSNTQTIAAQFGSSADKIVPADFSGDGKTDIAVWRESTGEWLILRSEDASYYSVPFGAAGDIPAPSDLDGDGKADTAVFRPGSGTWFISRSTGGTSIVQFGTSGDIPVAADYDGDGKSDIAIFRPSNGQWWLNRSTAGVVAAAFGTGTDKPVPADYTGDGRADIAFWRVSTGEWFILRSEDASYFSFPFGASGDVPAPGDYDGDGRWDAAVFRSGVWYVQQSANGTLIQQFGLAADKPVPSAFVP
jgi:uncharacterized delta-60 repeat protein